MSTPSFHPDLRAARFVPRTVVGPRTLRPVRLVTRALAATRRQWGAEELPVAPGVSVRLFRPVTTGARTPALLWLHSGGTVIGTARQDDRACRRFADRLGVTVASVEYRLAPEHPFPTPLHDCEAALRWLAGQPSVDPERIAIGGASAGGGLAAALALLTRDRGGVRPVLQLLSYPMLDDRTAARTDVDQRCVRIWNQSSNRFAWRSYLGPAWRAGDVPALAAPARAPDLSGLPPAWIGVGTCDLFHDEDVTYARRLREAGVPCTLHVVPGAYHLFDDTEPRAGVSRDFLQARTAALAAALHAG
ncbi:Acetyl esterase/lipase [Geodermatophilus saharensis]|uniref:Acetyl esterase/lipase n=1 Tax=Geodermatophilus saharensis TaxID=1137994 RepID=A0A239D122_9ACTN|nr:alpha/beta hydrolase [Geodermatophilus saharensis]SNS26115.1 Acetyl esterase/lipase [Geodermatophilus saharensis]